MTRTSGTKEWADSNINIYYGCSHNCRYCYAKAMAKRFYRVFPLKDQLQMMLANWGRFLEIMEKYYVSDSWEEMILNRKAFEKGYGKRKGRIMYPTSHDITPETIKNHITILKKILIPGNEVLITSKPWLLCIHAIIHKLRPWKNQIQFRFTITSKNNKTLEYWEPHAPKFIERIQSLKLAFYANFKTSVSMEPFLDKDPLPLILEVAPYTTESIWLGKLNYKKTDFNSWPHIKKILKNLKFLPEEVKKKIRLKDSIKNLIKTHKGEIS